MLQRKIFWAKEWNNLGNNYNIQWTTENLALDIWNKNKQQLIDHLKSASIEAAMNNARSSLTRVYKDLDFNIGKQYLNFANSPSKIMWIFKARTDLICLNGTELSNRNTLSTLCNLREDETIKHFLGICPVLSEFRIMAFNKSKLTDNDFIDILNGRNDVDWNNLIKFITCALNYRKYLINEFN
jgi:hypothetical protein